MAYRRSTRRTTRRASTARRSSRSGSFRRTARKTAGRRSSGRTSTVRIVIEQPSAATAALSPEGRMMAPAAAPRRARF